MGDDLPWQADDVYLTSGLLWVYASEEAKVSIERWNREKRVIGYQAISAIILSAISTESFINEVAVRLAEVGSTKVLPEGQSCDFKGIGEILKSLEEAHVQTTAKYLTAAHLLPGDPLKKGSKPYQDFKLLIDIRNHLVHPKPVKKEPSFVKVFRDKGWTTDVHMELPKMLPHTLWITQLMTPYVACWACRTSREIIHHILFQVLPESLLDAIATLPGNLWYRFAHVSHIAFPYEETSETSTS
jgi:hypothetical protein